MPFIAIASAILFLSSPSSAEVLEKSVDLKTFGFFEPAPIRPTAATIEFYPGVPPGWPRPSTKPPPPGVNRHDDIVDILNTTGAPYVLNPNFTHSAVTEENTQANRASFIEWLLGILGLGGGGTPGEKPEEVQPPKNCQKCTCGLAIKQRRIIGGVETNVNQYPWMVALMYNNRFYCGASVINNKYLITAAHCVNNFSKQRLSAVFLDHDRSNQFETQTFTRTISQILVHSKYNKDGAYNNDIALLKLGKELFFTGLLRPVCLPPRTKSFTNWTGVAVGWGATQVHGQVSNTLREVQVPILSNTHCRRTGYGYKITDNMLCAGYAQGMKDSCQGDSGGPLHVVNGTSHHIVGIVSWGEGCAEANFPGVYTRVNRYITWIESNTRDACYC